MSDRNLSDNIKEVRQQLDALLNSACQIENLPETASELVFSELSHCLESLQHAVDDLRGKHQAAVMHYQESAHQEKTYRDLFESAPIPYLVTDGEGQVILANQRACRLLEQPAIALIGSSLIVFPADQLEQSLSEWLAVWSEQLSSAPVKLEGSLCVGHIASPRLEGLFWVNAMQDHEGNITGYRWILSGNTNSSPFSDASVSPLKQGDQRSADPRSSGTAPKTPSGPVPDGSRRSVPAGHLSLPSQSSLAIAPAWASSGAEQPSPTIQQVLDTLVQVIQQALSADRVIAYGLDTASSEAPSTTVVAEARASLRWPAMHTVSADPLEIRALVESCRRSADNPVMQAPVTDFPDGLAESWQRHQVQSALVVPLTEGLPGAGLIAVHQCDRSRQWQSHELAVLNQLINYTQMALQSLKRTCQLEQLNASLASDLHKRTEQIKTAIQFESALKRITDSVRDSLDEAEILQTAVRELSEALGLGGCNAALYNLDAGTSTICYEYTNFIAASRGRVAQMSDFPEIYSQLHNGLFFQFCSLIPNPKRGRVSMLACPIFVDAERDGDKPENVLGDLWLIHDKDYVFNELEIRLVQQVANQCAIAIRQARLYQAVQGQVRELERLNRLKDEFLSTVSHELRTPISNVKMAIHMLKNTNDETRKQRYLDILEAESHREADLINDLLDLQKLEAANIPIHVESINLNDWLPRLTEPFNARMASHQQSFSLSCPDFLAPLSTDAAVLQRILSELLNNACKYTPGGKNIQLIVLSMIETHPEAAMAGICFKVCNQTEIPQTELPHIFDKFYRVPHADPWKQGGTGLGLALVQQLVNQIDGTIQVSSQGGWTTFTVAVPNQPCSAIAC